MKTTTVSRLRTAEASELFDELRQGSLEPIALLSNSEIVGYLVSARLWDATQAAEPDQDLAVALLRVAQLAAERLPAPAPQSVPALLPPTRVHDAAPRSRGRPARGGPKSAPEIWDMRQCTDCGKRVYTTRAEDRSSCRACEKKARTAGSDYSQHCSVEGCSRRIFVRIAEGRTVCRVHERELAVALTARSVGS